MEEKVKINLLSLIVLHVKMAISEVRTVHLAAFLRYSIYIHLNILY